MPSECRQALILDNLDLPASTAASIIHKRRYPPHVTRDEIESDGYIGLIKAADTYDPAKGWTFRRFATFRIRTAIVDGLRDRDWVPRTARAKGCSTQMVQDDSVGDWKKDLSVCDPSDTTARDMLFEAMSPGLDERERALVWLYYFKGKTLLKTSEELGLSESRISQIHQGILAKWLGRFNRGELPELAA